MPQVAISPQPRLQFNQNGVPLAGGLLFTYAAGTTNKLATSTDSTGATPNTNPIILNSNGECDCYLTAGLLYKFTLSPSTDTDPPTNPFWTEDNLYCTAGPVIPYADADGTADVVTASYVVASPVLTDGYLLFLDIATPNATTTPTFAPTLNGVLQTARTIVKMAGNVNVALAVGDLQGKVQLVYDLPNLKWVLLNPAGFAILQNTAAIKLPTITATVASNALTIGAAAQYMDFRSATIGSGVISTINATPANIVIPTTATLGTTNGVQSTLLILELNNAGVAELAICNASGVNLDETTLISTTAISAGSTSASVIYSTTGRDSLPFRIIGKIIITEATAGTWATAPSTITPTLSCALAVTATTALNAAAKTLGDNSLSIANTNYVALAVGSSINGLGMSTAGGSTTMSIATGFALDRTRVAIINIAAFTKTTASWTLGSAGGGLDTGASLGTASTWYYWYLIRRPDTGVVDLIFSLSAAAPTLPANYTQYRYIGASFTDGSKNWTAFTQMGREFYWSTPILDNSGAGSATASLLTCTLPLGRKMKAFFNVSVENNNGIGATYISDPDNTDLAPSVTVAPLAGVGATNAVATFGHAVGSIACWTNTSAQIRHRELTTNNLYIATLGWLDLADSNL